jgi:hypothetical protein
VVHAHQDLPDDSSPLVILDELLGFDLWETLVVQTTLYASQCGAELSSELSVPEMRAFCGLYMLMSVFVMADLHDYWHLTWGYDPIRSVMSRNRFKEILRFLHMVDNSQHVPSQDPFFKVRPLIDAFASSHLYVAPGQYLTCDERLIPFKVCSCSVVFLHLPSLLSSVSCVQGRSKLKVYVKNKPTKWGLKVCHLPQAGVCAVVL